MLALLILIPVFAGVASLYMYRHVGKKELMRMDLVQFVYGFVIFPVMFVWLKTFLYFLLSKELDVRLTVAELFIIDTFFTVVMLFVFAFEIIHILTKSFNLKYFRDPLYDVFEHSEYYHVWLSHLGMYFGFMVLFVLLGLINLIFPLEIDVPKISFYSFLTTGMAAGVVGFVGLWLSDSKETQFMRLIKLAIGFSFLILLVAYFLLDPSFNEQFGWYWFTLLAFFAMVVCSFLFEKSEKAKGFANRFKHKKWEKRLLGDLSDRWLKK